MDVSDAANVLEVQAAYKVSGTKLPSIENFALKDIFFFSCSLFGLPLYVDIKYELMHFFYASVIKVS
jgi:hypothetical protein